MSRHARRFRQALLIGLGGLVSACASDDLFAPVDFPEPETVVEYTPVVSGAPSDEIRDLMEESLLIFRRQDQAAQSIAFLRRRAQGDIEIAQKILRSYGYYGASVEARVRRDEGADEDEPDEDEPAEDEAGEDEAGEDEAGEAIAEIAIEPGAPFILSSHRVALADAGSKPPGLKPAAAYGSPVGKPAVAAEILRAEDAMVAGLRSRGRPYAKRTDRDAVADLEAATLEVETDISTGREYRFGPLTFEGNPDVERDYLLSYLPWEEGDLVDTAMLATFQRRLMETRLFRSGRVTIPDDPPEGDRAPVTVVLEEAEPRTIWAGLRYSTDRGPGVRLGFEHRNLFRNNERLEATLDANLDEQRLESEFRKPQFRRVGQDMVAGLELRRLEDDAYDERGGTVTFGIERRLGQDWEAAKGWTIGAGVLGEYSRITDLGITQSAVLGGIPLFAAYDGTDDLLDPTRGQRLRFDITPFGGTFGGDFTTFFKLQSRGSVYQRLTSDGSVVAAARGRVGSILADALSDVPQTRRFYSGGGGSVRGYEQDIIGPLDITGDPIGGRSVIELGGELRAKVWGNIALATFVEAGAVSTSTVPSFAEGIQVAAGGGLRYHSPVGPIRLDVGVPINARDVDDAFQVYISIGQAY